jgi:hypothetical protein
VAEDDRRAICEILAGIAANLGYTEADEPKTPDTLAGYRSSTKRPRIWLRARTAGGAAVVGVTVLTRGIFAFGQMQEYMRVRDRVERGLRARFGSRVRRMRRGE